MNGYNTGWKFANTWYFAAEADAGLDLTITAESGSPSVGTPAFRQATQIGNPQVISDDILCGSVPVRPIMVHGYNGIRLRFLVNPLTDLAADLIGIHTWEIYLVESDGEEDQKPNEWFLMPLACVAVNAQATATTVSNYLGKGLVGFANQARVVVDRLCSSDVWTSSESNTDGWAAPYMYNTTGADVQTGPSTVSTAGVPSQNVFTKRMTLPAFTPGNASSSAISKDAIAEVYIPLMAGASRILVIPRVHIGYSALAYWTTTSPLSTSAIGPEKYVSFMYNLTQ